MRTSPTLIAMEPPAEAAEHSLGADHTVEDVIRTLTGLIETVSRRRTASEPPGSSTEEVLVDTEVDGSRYLLVRMRRREAIVFNLVRGNKRSYAW